MYHRSAEECFAAWKQKILTTVREKKLEKNRTTTGNREISYFYPLVLNVSDCPPLWNSYKCEQGFARGTWSIDISSHPREFAPRRINRASAIPIVRIDAWRAKGFRLLIVPAIHGQFRLVEMYIFMSHPSKCLSLFHRCCSMWHDQGWNVKCEHFSYFLRFE